MRGCHIDHNIEEKWLVPPLLKNISHFLPPPPSLSLSLLPFLYEIWRGKFVGFPCNSERTSCTTFPNWPNHPRPYVFEPGSPRVFSHMAPASPPSRTHFTQIFVSFSLSVYFCSVSAFISLPVSPFSPCRAKNKKKASFNANRETRLAREKPSMP